MKKNVLVVALALMASIGAYAEKNTISSPDGKLNVVVEDRDGKLYYSIDYAGKRMMEESQLGLLANVGDFSQGLTYQNKKEAKVEKSYDLRSAKVSHVDYHANQLNVTYLNGKKEPMTVTFNVSNNDVAFRYTFDGLKAQHIIINEEKTTFNLPKISTSFLCPQSDPLIGFARTKPSYEEDYKPDAPLTAKSGYGRGYTFPCLFKVGGEGWVLVSETGSHGNYPGCHISDYDAAKGYQIAFPMEKEADGIGSTSGAFILPGSTPWRTITVGSDLKPLVETTIPYDVVEPRFEASQKYGTGKYAWSWLIWQDGSCNYNDQKQFIDLAATMGYEYVLVDALWDTQIGRDKIAELSKYAQSKNVSLTASQKLGNFQVSLRERWQYTYRPEKTIDQRWDFDDDEYDGKSKTYSGRGKNILRSRVQISYDIPNSHFESYVSAEMYNGWSVEKMRYTAGVDWKITKKHAVGAYYLYQAVHDDDDDNEPNLHILGLEYKFKF